MIPRKPAPEMEQPVVSEPEKNKVPNKPKSNKKNRKGNFGNKMREVFKKSRKGNSFIRTLDYVEFE